MSKGPPHARLDRLLANMGYGSRREIGVMANAGWIKLDGADLSDVGARVGLTPDLPARLLIRGKPIDPLPGMAIMIHKPVGVTCSRKEAGGLIYDLLPDRWRAREPALSTVGRLDKETSGLLLMTDDGDLLRPEALCRNLRPAINRRRGGHICVWHYDAGRRAQTAFASRIGGHRGHHRQIDPA